MSMNISNWNNVIIKCSDSSKIRNVSDICQKNRARMILIENNFIERAIIAKSLLKSNHVISTEISKIDQRTPGFEKFIGLHADVFDLNSFELSPIKTDNPHILLNDLRICSEFLVNKIDQTITIGWNLSNDNLSGGGFVKLLDNMVYGYKPNYIRFGKDQDIAANTTKRVLAIKIALPYDSETDSDYRIVLDSQL